MVDQLTAEQSNLVNQEITREYQKVTRSSGKPKVLICTPEITELPEGMGNAANFVSAKGGGLGDISASLIRYLNDSKEFELHIAIPKYDYNIRKVLTSVSKQQIDRLAIVLSGKGIHLINDSAFSYIKNPYETHWLHSGIRRAMALQRYVINNLIDQIEPDVVHCNDWMTALIPAATKVKGIKSIFTLHNIFTAKQTLEQIELTGIKPFDFAEWLYFEQYPEDLEHNWEKHFRTNHVDFTASAIFAADHFNTVSPSFLEELKNDVFGELVPRSIFQTITDKINIGRASGILNAPNDTVNPSLMENIINFGIGNVMEKKEENKLLFQQKMRLPKKPNIPLFFWPNRLYDQKGTDILVDNLEMLVKKYTIQIAVVANGDEKQEKALKTLSRIYSNISYRPFSEPLGNLGKAGSDFILMPSRYEPCGLPQMEAPRLGTLPIVRATGGLKDTITHLDFTNGYGNGFVFNDADRYGLEFGIKEALRFYSQPYSVKEGNLRRIMQESMEKFNLKNTAEEYIKIYKRLTEERRNNL
ncbi:MAG: glycogen/starch synthase [Candidatus Cloacimonetes bacterium]|nr:glycogen/starch synthase [Candidatus Cloacimonadota bacterium]